MYIESVTNKLQDGETHFATLLTITSSSSLQLPKNLGELTCEIPTCVIHFGLTLFLARLSSSNLEIDKRAKKKVRFPPRCRRLKWYTASWELRWRRQPGATTGTNVFSTATGCEIPISAVLPRPKSRLRRGRERTVGTRVS